MRDTSTSSRLVRSAAQEMVGGGADAGLRTARTA
jgi:hypothetical protein